MVTVCPHVKLALFSPSLCYNQGVMVWLAGFGRTQLPHMARTLGLSKTNLINKSLINEPFFFLIVMVIKYIL